jgi:DNA-binding NarL/FixJ family response regulator
VVHTLGWQRPTSTDGAPGDRQAAKSSPAAPIVPARSLLSGCRNAQGGSMAVNRLRAERSSDISPTEQRAPVGQRQLHAPRGGVGETRIVGRAKELQVLDRTLTDLMAGRGRALLIAGEAGVGKTALVRHILSYARSRGVRVLHGSGVPFSCDLPLRTVTDAFGDEAIERDVRAAAARGGHHAFRAVAALLARLGQDGPVILALDDVQWADPATCELMAHLLYRWPAGPLLGVLSLRSEQAPIAFRSAVSIAAAERRIVLLQLAPLTQAEADEMLGSRLPAAARARLYRLSGGNPFLLAALANSPDERTTPPSVRRLVDDEAASLSPDARLLMEGASVAGEPFDLAIAATSANIPTRKASSLLDELCARALIREDEEARAHLGTWHRGRLVFRHPIMARALYESTREGWRIGAHARAAELLAARGAPVAMRAHHVERYAEPGDRSAALLLERAGRAAAYRDPSTAARWLAATLRILSKDEHVDRRLSLLLLLATNLGIAARTAECRSVLDEALDIAARNRLPAWRAQCVATAARVHHVIADRPDMLALVKAGLRRDVPGRHQASLHACISAEHWLACEWAPMALHATIARRNASRSRDDARVALSSALLGVADEELGATASALDDVQRAQKTTDALTDGEAAHELELLWVLGQAEHQLGQHPTALGHLERGLAIARATGQELFVAPIAASLAVTRVALGRLEPAAQAADEAVSAATRLKANRPLSMALAARCLVALRRGDLVDAAKAAIEARDAARKAGTRLLDTTASCWLGEALIESGAHDQGKTQILDDCGGASLSYVPTHLRSHVYVVLCKAELARGRIDDAERWIAASEAHARRVNLASVTAQASDGRAMMLVAKRDPRAAALAAATAATYAELGQQVESATATVLEAQALADRRDREGALTRLQAAYVDLESCGALRARDRVASELRALGRRVGRSGRRTGGPDDLTDGLNTLSPRERDVAERVASGYTNQRIAEELYLSVKTIETHVSKIFDKLGVSSRAQVAAHWVTHAPATMSADMAAAAGERVAETLA